MTMGREKATRADARENLAKTMPVPMAIATNPAKDSMVTRKWA